MNGTTSDDLSGRVKLLKSISIFKDLDNALLNDLAGVLTPKSIQVNEVLFKKGDKDYSLYLVVSGKVKVHSGDHIFAYFCKNEYFGEYSLVDSSSRSASVTAVEPTDLLRLDQKVFYSLLEKLPDISQAMLKGLVLRLRDYNKLEAELTQKNVEIEKQAKELEEQRAELEALNSTKDKFFAIIAHDLKNPFSTVLGLSELLAREFETFDSQSLKNFITQIYKYSNSTFNLLENLLQWSMVQTGRMPLKPNFISLKDIIQDSIELLIGSATNKSIEIEMLLSEDCTAFGDANQITTVVRNLLTNAIKFTSTDGKISVSVTSQGDFWLVSVADNGIGVSEHDKTRLFNIDSNPTNIGTSQEKGTGLGLILCREFVERNGGRIWVESSLGKGSNFLFTIPKSDKNLEIV